MSRFLRLLEYAAVRTLMLGLQSVPYGLSVRLARGLGRTAYGFAGKLRKLTADHLRLAYGAQLSEDGVDRIAQGVFETIALHVAEVAHLTRRAGFRVRIENGHLLQEAHARGRGVVVVSAHMGCWVRMVVIPRLMRLRAAVIMKRQKNDRLLDWGIRHLKRHFDMDVILKKDARDEVAGWLKGGGVVAFFADQHPRTGGFPARFFGKEIVAASGPAVYAKRYDCPLVVFTAAQEPDGTHVLRFDGPVPTDGSLEGISQKWLDLLEARIRDHPEQWMWMHRRWRNPQA